MSLEVVPVTTVYLATVHHQQNDSGQDRHVKRYPEGFPHRPGHEYPAQVIDDLVGSAAYRPRRAYYLSTCFSRQYTETKVNDDQYETQQQEPLQRLHEVKKVAHDRRHEPAYHVSLVHDYFVLTCLSRNILPQNPSTTPQPNEITLVNDTQAGTTFTKTINATTDRATINQKICFFFMIFKFKLYLCLGVTR